MGQEYIINLQSKDLFKSTEWLTKHNYPNSFIIKQAIGILPNRLSESGYMIDLIVNKTTLNPSSELKCSFSDIKINRKDAYYINELESNNSKMGKIAKAILEQTYENKEVDNSNKNHLKHSIQLNMQDEELHNTTYGDTYQYYITDIRYNTTMRESYNSDTISEFQAFIDTIK